MNILILTNTAEYVSESTLYPLVRHLSAHASVRKVFVADKAISGNESFFNGNIKPDGLLGRVADPSYAFENQTSYPAEPVPFGDIDAISLRYDLAPDSLLHRVEKIWPKTFISNNPTGIMRTGTKSFLLSLQPFLGDLMPRVQLCQTVGNVRAFCEQSPDIVLKVLNSFGGKGVVRLRAYGESDLQNDAQIDEFLHKNGACLAMQYLDNPRQSDNRLIVSNGEVLGVLARVAKKGDWRCNLMAGGSYEFAQATDRELEMVRRVDPIMKQMGIHFYGVDTLMDAEGKRYLSELNTMNPGCARRYELTTGRQICKVIADDFIRNAHNALSSSGERISPKVW